MSQVNVIDQYYKMLQIGKELAEVNNRLIAAANEICYNMGWPIVYTVTEAHEIAQRMSGQLNK